MPPPLGLQPQNLRVQPLPLDPAPQKLGGARGPREAVPQELGAAHGRLDLVHGRHGTARRKLGGEILRHALGSLLHEAARERLDPVRRRLGRVLPAPRPPRCVRRGLSLPEEGLSG